MPEYYSSSNLPPKLDVFAVQHDGFRSKIDMLVDVACISVCIKYTHHYSISVCNRYAAVNNKQNAYYTKILDEFNAENDVFTSFNMIVLRISS